MNKKVVKIYRKEAKNLVMSLLKYMGWWDRILFVFGANPFEAIERAEKSKIKRGYYSVEGWEKYLLGFNIVMILIIVFCLGGMV